MGSKKNVDMSADETTVKIVESAEVETDDTKVIVKTANKRNRSKKYLAQRSRVDKTKNLSVSDAVALVKTLSYSKFDGTITLDGLVKETGKLGTFSLPHSTGKTITVAIVNDEIIAEIADGKINFDALITTPEFMPKLAKHARVLGPRGLMPNPKNGTVTAKPEEKKAELEKGSFDLKTEKKQPVIHVTVGKVSLDDKKIIENIEYLFKVLNDKLVSASISATMSSSVKIEITE